MRSHLQVDEESPFVREWALWGIRNLCEGNDAVQESIKDLQALQVSASPELQGLGFHVEMDTASGKPRITSRPK